MNTRSQIKPVQILPTLLALFIGALFFASLVGQSAAKSKEEQIRDKWAVVIGASKFQDQSIPPLKMAGASAVELAATLKDPETGRFGKKNVVTVTGKHATKQTLELILSDQWLLKKALPADYVLIYLSGRIMPGAEKLNPLFITYDSLLSDQEPAGIPVRDALATLAKRTQSKNILLVLDTSPVPDFKARGCGEFPSARELARAAGVSVVTANTLAKPSEESATQSSSAFTHYFTEGIKAGSGLLPLSAIGEYVNQSIQTENRGKITQVAQIEPAEGNQAILELAPGLSSRVWKKNKPVSIGHKVSELHIKRPDLIKGSTKPRKRSESQKAKESDQDQDTPLNPNLDFSAYMKKMKRDIQSQWQPPKGFKNQHVVTVFTIMQDGTIKSPSIVKSSNSKEVDQSAMDALAKASPLDPLPLGAPRYVQIRYQFDWKVKRTAKRQ